MQRCGIINLNLHATFLGDRQRAAATARTCDGAPMPDESDAPFPMDHSDLDAGLDPDSGTLMRRWVIVRHKTVWRPPTDVYERDERLIVIVEIAGMSTSDFHITLQGQQLVISGVRQRTTPTECAYHQLEIPYGEFHTEVSLPWPVVRDEVTASYRDGFLRVELPHAPAQKIQIVTVDLDDESGHDAPSDPDDLI